ncbi:hypothetical protein CRUP_017587, partial [Coryphaenoides rupestris]
RRDYSALTKFLPPKHEYVLAVRVTPLQYRLYRHYLDHYTTVGQRGHHPGSGSGLFKDFQILGRVWAHPWCLHLNYISKENKGTFEGKNQVKAAALLGPERVGGEKEMQSSGSRMTSNLLPAAADAAQPASSWMTDSALSEGWYRGLLRLSDATIVQHSGKMVLLFEILRMAEELKDKVLVFSQSLISLDLIEDFLTHAHQSRKSGNPLYEGSGSWIRNVDYYRLDGTTTATFRKKWAEDFNNLDNTRGRLFLISTRAGSLGINLVASNRVIIFDASWNPSYDIQSIFRVYRFGQLKSVYVYRFLAQGTMEEKIYDRQVAKQSLSFRVSSDHELNISSLQMKANDQLMDLVKQSQGAVNQAFVSMQSVRCDNLQSYVDRVRQQHPTASEKDVRDNAERWRLSEQKEHRRRQALTHHIEAIITSRRNREIQVAMATANPPQGVSSVQNNVL